MNTPLNDSKIKIPYMRDMTQQMNHMLHLGYDKNFKVVPEGLQLLETSQVYQPSDLLIVNYFRYEGISDPEDNSILYIIETNDGQKGTLLDAYGMYSDPLIEKFMKNVKIEDRTTE
ncbi:MAG TPA: hypothetical protein VD884_07925 [Ohtaekwangia sp.]|nr:hypothetical protein [Ohtaekwangia sp.]